MTRSGRAPRIADGPGIGIQKAYATIEEINDEIKLCQGKAAKMRPSLEKQSVMAHISRLRAMASAKQWLARAPLTLPKS
jgi:hypothetical protein